MFKIVIISDTHNRHQDLILPDGDMIIHAGDFTNKGQYLEIRDFMVWFSKLNYKYRIFIAGNHELKLDEGPGRISRLECIQGYVNTCKGLHYLENNSIQIENYKIYGSPITPFFYDWAWNVPRGEEIAKKWKLIPEDTDVLVTHGPPYGLLDLVEISPFEDRDVHQGCEELKKRVDFLKNLKLHAFGHLHGNEQLIKVNGCTFVNAAMVNDRHQLGPKPVIIEL